MSAYRQAIAPAYLFACVVMGGSAQGIFSNLALQLAGIVILAWAFLATPAATGSRPARQLGWLAAGAVGLVLIQLVPLPPAVWTSLPGRDIVVEGFALLGQPVPWMPLSLAPAETIATAMAMIPPLAMLALVLRLGAYRDSWLLIALLVATFISVGLGMLQIQSGGTGPYLYPRANLGTASGLFANANHMATLLLASTPFLVALAARRWRQFPAASDKLLTATLAGGAAAVLTLGVAANKSFAMLLIGIPVVSATALQLVQLGPVLRKYWAILVICLVIGGSAIALAASTADIGKPDRTSVQMRTEIWSTTTEAIRDFNAAGSGIGTFSAVYPAYEDPATVERTYINHAHNDYLEIALEGGLPAFVLMALFVMWWGSRAVAIWGSPDSGEFRKAACIASAAILLHSMVDYPLRTTAIATVFAMALALMAEPWRPRQQTRLAELRPTRHLNL